MDRSHAARLLPCRPKGPNLPRLRTRRATKGHKGRQRTARGPVRAWRASHATLWFWGAQAAKPRPICPIGPICPTAASTNQRISESANQRGASAPLGTSQTCRGCRGKWKFGSLDAWKFGFLVVQLFRLSPACRAFCSPWPWKVWPFGPARSVLRSPGRESALPLPGYGATPHLSSNQFPNPPRYFSRKPQRRKGWAR